MEQHRTEFRLTDIILGGQDGLVNVLGVILGVAAASQSPRLVIAAGLSATFAESISMAAVAYTSKRARADFYESEVNRETREMKDVPSQEVEEIRQIYRERGFDGPLLEEVVAKIVSNPKVWLEVMMREELKLEPVAKSTLLASSVLVGASAVVGSLIPLLPFIFLPLRLSLFVSVFLAALTLLLVGAYKARQTVGKPLKSGLEMAVIGTVSALAGYLVGIIFKVS
ncbi:MAG: VIT1/CCC1 transporter family protein [Patescibacteria group bacterium]|nr:VIT1/CCC1 transporter family protein [Patescibacteria group bacterium]